MIAKNRALQAILLIQLLCFGIFASFCKSPIAYKSLIILLDRDQEETCAQSLEQDGYSNTSRPEGVGAITSTLIVALHQKAAPILASKSLLKNIHDHALIFEDFVFKRVPIVLKKYRSFKRFSSLELIKQFCMQASYTASMYELVNSSLKSLLPNTYDTSHAHLIKIIKKICNSPAFSLERAPLLFTQVLTQNSHKLCYNELATYMLCLLATQELKHWASYSVSHDLCILVPLDHLDTCKNQWELGLKLGHLQPFTPSRKQEPTQHSDSIISCLKNIFITKQEYKKQALQAPCWNIYLTGHGSASGNYKQQCDYYQVLEKFYKNNPQKINVIKGRIRDYRKKAAQGTIASVSIGEFKNLLLFLDTQLSVGLLFYASCYAGGYHLELPYMRNNKPLRLHYTVVSGALAESPIKQHVPSLALPPYYHIKNGNQTTIYGITPQSIDIKKKQLVLTTTFSFNHFFTTLSQEACSIQTISHAIDSVHTYRDKTGCLIKEYACNIPWIRPALKDTFRLMLTTQNKLAHTCLTNQESRLKTHMFSDSLDWQICSTLSRRNTPLSIYSLETYSDTLADIVEALIPLQDLRAQQVFFIEKLLCKIDPELSFVSNLSKSNFYQFSNVIITYGISTDSLLTTTEITDKIIVYFTYNFKPYRLIYYNNKLTSIKTKQPHPELKFIATYRFGRKKT